ncbi:MAG TPA: FMN-binding negative transcriptional regulator [Jatrophihabitans sp.]|nr:FMN-binding negative transcriptional regulator [Jatrophihabitans sp.]
MYVPGHFEASAEQLGALLAAPGLVELVTAGPDGLIATPLPMLHVPETGSLVGHVARNNPHWQADGADSLAIVRGPQAYVSPAWLRSKPEHGRVVPTWNYLTAHVHGRLVAHDSVDWVRELVTRLTAVHEDSVGSSWQPSDAPLPYLEGQLRAIVGLELVITRIEAKAKLSQNRPTADQQSVAEALASRSEAAAGIARLMRGDG